MTSSCDVRRFATVGALTVVSHVVLLVFFGCHTCNNTAPAQYVAPPGSPPAAVVCTPAPSPAPTPEFDPALANTRYLTSAEAATLQKLIARSGAVRLPVNEPVVVRGESNRRDTPVMGALGTDWWLYHDTREFADLANGGTDKASVHQYQMLYARMLRPYREHASFAPARKAMFPHLEPHIHAAATDHGAPVPPELQPFKLFEIGLGCTMSGGPAGGYHLLRRFLPNVKYHGFEYDYKLCTDKWNSPAAKAWLTTKADIAYLTENHVDGDQNNIEDLNRAIDKFGFVDIIVDDGSHCMDHQKRTFRHLFLNMLRPGGVYIIEDLSANFATFGKWKAQFCASTVRHRRRETMVQYVHDLITTMAYVTTNKRKFYGNEIDWGGPDVEVSQWVQQVVCDREVCAVTKKTHPYSITGSEGLVPKFPSLSAAGSKRKATASRPTAPHTSAAQPPPGAESEVAPTTKRRDDDQADAEAPPSTSEPQVAEAAASG